MEVQKSAGLGERLRLVIGNRGNRDWMCLVSEIAACHEAHNAILRFRGDVAIYKGVSIWNQMII